jgi:hypothetical protein
VLHEVFIYLFSNSASVNKLRAGANDTADLSCLLKVANGPASKTGVDLHAVRDDGSGDELVGGDILQDLIVGLLVKDDRLLSVLLHLGLGPLLLKTSTTKTVAKKKIFKERNLLLGLSTSSARFCGSLCLAGGLCRLTLSALRLRGLTLQK